MIKEIKDMFSDDILSEAAKRFGSSFGEVKLIGGYESFVYEFEKEGRPYILKITHTIRRTPGMINGELEFVNHLADKGVGVSKAVISVKGNLVEVIPGKEGNFLAYVFEKAEGELIKNEDLTDDMLFKWGRLTGLVNLHSQSFIPSDEAYRRQHWKDEMKEYFDRFLPEDEVEVKEKAHSLFDRLDKLPRSRETFGLVHTDIHQGNFFHKDGRLTVFDFDDSSYHYFAHEIAIALYYSSQYMKIDKNYSEYVEQFKKHFVGGYRSVKTLTEEEFRNIPDFLRLRHALLYSVLCNIYGKPEDVDEKHKEMIKRHKERVLDDSWTDEGFLN